MKKLFLPLLLLLSALVSLAQAPASRIEFYQDHADGQYRLGEDVRVFARADGPKEWTMTVTVNGIRGESEPIGLSGEMLPVFDYAFDEPTAVILTLSDPDKPAERYETGFIVGAEGFRPGFEAPRDLRKYWKKEIRAMRREKMEVKLTPVFAPKTDSDSHTTRVIKSAFQALIRVLEKAFGIFKDYEEFNAA